jgi:RNA polymerase sigma-70 factor (ECF subfamily)
MDEDVASIQRLQAGDERGLSELMQRHKEPIFRFAYRYTLNAAEAADIAQETFVRVYFNADRFRPKAKVTTWIFTIAANLCRDWLRKNRKRSLFSFLDQPIRVDSNGSVAELLASDDPDAVAQALSAEAVKMVESVIQSLPEKLLFPFVFCVLEENSYEQCAEVLHTSTKTVETRIYRARQQLKKLLS